jgi:hypothetical protein
LNVLIACEYSGEVREAFAARGHNAWSCDLLPSEREGNHIQGDIFNTLRCVPFAPPGTPWDLLIAHPPCTRLCNSGVLRLYRGGKAINGRDPQKWADMEQGAQFFKRLWDCQVPKVCLENPVMHGHAARIIGAKHSQTIQPFEFGHPESKRTALWLRGLPLLRKTNILPKPECGHWENQTPSGQNKLGPSPTRGHERARTYAGIANAMAEQWGNL